jgi:hypothetical protein
MNSLRPTKSEGNRPSLQTRFTPPKTESRAGRSTLKYPPKNSLLERSLAGITPRRLVEIFTQRPKSFNPANSVETRVKSIRKPRSGRPKLIIKWGPPASGKGSPAMTRTIESEGDSISSYININVDAVVESTLAFRNESRQLFEKWVGTKFPSRSIRSISNEEIINKLGQITRRNAEKLGVPYGRVRTTANIWTGQPISSKQDALLGIAIQNKRNITFETTGQSGWPNWLFVKYPSLKTDYKVIVIFPMVPFTTAWKRYRGRPLASYRKGEGFRFASNRSTLRETYMACYEQFIRSTSRAAITNLVSKFIVLRQTQTANGNTRIQKLTAASRRPTGGNNRLFDRSDLQTLRDLARIHLENMNIATFI